MNVNNKIKKIVEALNAPNYFFYKTKDNEIMIRFEDEDEKEYTFRGYSMLQAVKDAEDWIKENIVIDDKKQTKLFDDEKE